MCVNVYKSRQRKVKSYKKVQELEENFYRIIRIIAHGRTISCTAQRAREQLPIRFRQVLYDVVKETKKLIGDLQV
ncbi:hypothetical protein JTE90_021331 [Oedothorax gibbosus]|uniref:Uncharacterized protein n=1 Tax=Oedothorax gibbosus TaxID=931172 RepID=A0AAV6VN72_9ARAC|nr:hypothetical protein JTE90_021331 [Oedothorax gibbosus]